MNLRDVFGRNITISKGMRARFQKLAEKQLFSGRDLKWLFMICVSLGYKKNRSVPFKKGEDTAGLLNISSFSEEELWALAALAVEQKNGDLKTLENGAEIKRIASAFANAGLDELERFVAAQGAGDDFLLELENIGKVSLKR